MEASLIPQSNHGIMDEEGAQDLGSTSSFSEASSTSSNGSSSSDFTEDTSSSASSSSQSLNDGHKEGPLYGMSSLIAQLPFKRGLSRHYEGKSQSFASLSNVRCLEDLAKPERPLRKKLKSSQSCGGGLDNQRSLTPKGCSRTISKKASRASLSSLSGKRQSFLGSRPPIPPQRTNNLCCHTLLFA